MTGFPAAVFFAMMLMSYQDYNNNHNSNYRGRRFREEPQPSVTEQESFDVDETYTQQTRTYRGYDDERTRAYRPRETQPYRGQQNAFRQDYYRQDGYSQRRYPQRSYDDREQYSDGYSADSRYRQRQPARRPRQYDYNDRYVQNQRSRRSQYEDDYRRQKPKKKGSVGAAVVRGILIVVLIVAGFMIGKQVWEAFDAKKAFDQLASLVGADRQNYQELAAKNSDFFGWLKIDDTVVNYPVMHTPGNPEKYLHMDFDGDYSDSGCLFLDAECRSDGNMYLIYGHHMINGSMFGSLPKYEDYDYYSSHKTIKFDTLNSIGDYEIFAVFRSQVYDDGDDVFKYYEFKNLDDQGTFDYYVSNVKALSLYDTGITPTYGDKLIALSTCNYHTSDGRFVVVGRKK